MASCELLQSLGQQTAHTHEFGEWSNTQNATCTNEGVKVRYCSCGEKQSETTPKLSHKVAIDVAVAPTCTKAGFTEGKYCSVCNETIIAQTTIAAIGHTEVVDKAIAPTCTSSGFTEGKHCSVCNEVLVAQTVVDALGHTEVVDNAVASTCTTTGLTEGKHCSVCNQTIVAQIETPKINHYYDDKFDAECNECGFIRDVECAHTNVTTLPAKNATCTEPGLTEGKVCVDCEAVIVAQTTIDALGHTEVIDTAIAPTYESTGLSEGKHCSVCRTVIISQQILPLLQPKQHSIVYTNIKTAQYPTVNSYVEHIGLLNLPQISADGYIFIGWYTAATSSSASTLIEYIPAGDTKDYVLVARWEQIKYTITYKNAAEHNNPIYYTVDDEITFSTPNWPGLIFSHWTDKEGTPIFGIEKGTIGNIVVEANWKYAENLTVSNPDKYTYIGGMLDSNCNYYFIYDIGIIENVVLSTKYTLRYDCTNAINRTETVTYKVQTTEAQTVSESIANTIINTTSFSSTKDLTQGDTNSTEFNFCPEIEIKGVKVKIFEWKKGSSNYDETKYEDTKSTVKGNESSSLFEISSYISYVFEEETSTQISINLSPEISPKGTYRYVRACDIRVYAIVVYDPNNNKYYIELYSQVEEVYDRTLFELADGEQNSVNIAKSEQLAFDIPTDVIPTSFYTVKYDPNGGYGKMLKSVHEIAAESNLIPNTFKKDGYIFSGWKTSTEDSASLYSNGESIINATRGGETLTLYAHWTPCTYTVTFDEAGGDKLSSSTHIVTFNEKYGLNASLPKPYRKGYKFDGWYNGNERIDDDSIVITASDHKLTAKWIPREYLLIFDANGGICTNYSKVVLFGEKYGELPTPERDYYIFDGWYTEADGGIQIEESSIVEAAEDENITLYAHWTLKTYFITVRASSFTWSYKVKYGDTFSFDLDQTNFGSSLTFRGWYYSEKDASGSNSTTGFISHITDSKVFIITINESIPIFDDKNIYITAHLTSDDSSCLTGDTLATLADGTQVRVDSLTGDELLLVWNLETGKFDFAPIMFVDSDALAEFEVIYLHFSDGTVVKVITEHGFWDYDLNKYVYLDANAADYIGHCFAKQDGDDLVKVQLVDVEIRTELTTAWSPVTVGHLCYFVNGMLSMPGGVGGLFNIFDVDGETMTYDYEAIARDIETYGLFTYEELNAIFPLSEAMFEAAGGAYLKISIGKGNLTMEELGAMINRYSIYV